MFVCRGIQGVGISGVKRPDKLVKTSIGCLKEMQEGGEEGELVVGGRGDIFIGGSRDVVGGSGNGVVDRVVESRLSTHLLPLGSTVRYKFTFARRGWGTWFLDFRQGSWASFIPLTPSKRTFFLTYHAFKSREGIIFWKILTE